MTAGAVAVPTIVPLRAPTPGQHKTLIDSNTKIELRTETPGATIYYTTNGLNPKPFQKHGPEAKATMKYSQPFRIAGGRRTVKAIAVAIDGVRESHQVSKTFDVEQLPLDEQYHDDDGTRFIDDIPYADIAKREVAKMGMVSSKQAWAELQAMKRKDEMMRELTLTDGSKHNRGTRFTNSRMGLDRSGYGGLAKGRSENGLHTLNSSTGKLIDAEHRAKKMPDTATQAMRLQRETDFLKCVYCFASRPADPFARFCNECGNPVQPLPETRIAPPEAGQMGVCIHCKSQVPFNTDKCLICEADIPVQNRPMASVKLANKTVCTVCGTGNQANLTTCVTCEAELPLSAFTAMAKSATMDYKKEGRMQTCTKCGRVNSSDARFCDWCGTKPAPVNATLVCSKCHASNNAYATYCASCGDVLEAPQRPEVTNSGLRITNTGERNGTAQWMPVGLVNPVPKYDVTTQTVGIHYPSEKSLAQMKEKEEEKQALMNSMSDKKPVLTAVSPGKGYWRKQIDHINAHIKAHAQNNAEFRALIAEPRMGKILSTAVHEDGYELSLTVNFALRGNKDPFVGDKMGYSKRDFLSSYTKRSSLASYGSQDSLGKKEEGDVSGRSSARSTRSYRKKSARKAKKKPNNDSKLQEEDKMLFKEVGKNGEGRPSEISHWVEQGADPNSKNKDDYPVLHVACANKHLEAIPILVQEGADINAKGPNKGNTALHDAVNTGSGAREVIETLLKSGAKTTIKNDKGQTPYEMALELGYESIANMFSAKMGLSTLKTMTKPKQKYDDDEF